MARKWERFTQHAKYIVQEKFDDLEVAKTALLLLTA